MNSQSKRRGRTSNLARETLLAWLIVFPWGGPPLRAQESPPPPFVYVMPDGRVQTNPNVYAKRVAWDELTPEQQRTFLENRRPARTVGERLREFGERMTAILAERPATRVRVLLACDTDASKIAPGVAINRRRMEEYFADAFRGRETLAEVTTLAGSDVTAEKILGYYRGLDSQPTETLVFYYSGHGGSSKQGDQLEHYLALTHGRPLMRAELRRQMEERPHQSVILLTDCCSTSVGVSDEQIKEYRQRNPGLFGDDDPLGMPGGVDRRTTDSLWLRHTGAIDLTAATLTRDQYAWINNDRLGGFFTYALLRLLRSDVNVANRGRRRVEGVVKWDQAFGHVQVWAAGLSLGRQGLPPLNAMKKSPRERDYLWQWAYAFSFH